MGEYTKKEISELGECLAEAYFESIGSRKLPVEPEIIATKFFGLSIEPKHQLTSAGVRSGIDTSQSLIFIDYDTYMDDDKQPYARQGIAHELGHAIFDTALIREIARASNSDDAYELHHKLTLGKQSIIEMRANNLGGAMLVPRQLLLKRVSRTLAEKYDIVTEMFPHLTLGDALDQMGASQLSRYFGVSNDVIHWRLIHEELHLAFGYEKTTKLTDINLRIFMDIAGMEVESVKISDTVANLLPPKILLGHQRGWSFA